MLTYSIVVAWVIIPRMGSGLNWRHFYSTMTLNENYDCLRYWWTNLLFINTYKMGFCLPWSWYITTDFHFFLLLPFLVLPIVYFGGKVGLFVNFCAMAITLSFVSEMDSYVKANSRAAPFIIGVVSSYYISVVMTKDNKPEQVENKASEPSPTEMTTANSGTYVEIGTLDNQSEVSFFFSKKTYDKPWFRYMMYVASATCLIYVIEEFYRMSRVDFGDSWSEGELKRFRLTKEVLWAAGISFISIPFVMGHGGFVKKCLSLPIWTVLGKLTFGAYLVHPLLVVIFACSSEKLVYATSESYLLWVGIAALAYISAFLMWCMIECPFSAVVFIISNEIKFRTGAIIAFSFFSFLVFYGAVISPHVSDPLPIRETVIHYPALFY